jgi:isocitrate dehydrogenase kinase/phosphatase
MRSRDHTYASSEQHSTLTPSSNFIPEPQKQRDSSLVVRNVEQWLVRRLLQLVKDYPLSLVLWDGQRMSLHPQPELALVIHDRAALYTLLRNPD